MEQPRSTTDGFWEALAERASGETRVPMEVRFSASHKQPFDLVLTAVVPIRPGRDRGRDRAAAFPAQPKPARP